MTPVLVKDLPDVLLPELSQELPMARVFIMAQVVCAERTASKLVLRSTVAGAEDENLMALQLEVAPHLIFPRGHGQIIVFNHLDRIIEFNSAFDNIRQGALQLLRRAYPQYTVSLLSSP